jgi:hypothetical protein
MVDFGSDTFDSWKLNYALVPVGADRGLHDLKLVHLLLAGWR